ncbi:MAG: hypothetical protein DHS20C14_05160 [Phycisphaeraceae bacterium]|nr:MAG: hypothetical protein DHS20C14_05160 [Phycisphaeraceae bacterium]
MTRDTLRACLFGGAVFAAGLAAAEAHADEFIIGATTHNGGYTDGPYAYVYTLDGGFAYDAHIAAPFGPTTASAYVAGSTTTNFSRVVLSSEELSATNIKSDGLSYFNYTAATTDFLVADTMDVLITWDVDTALSSGNRTFELLSTSPFATVFDYQGLAPAEQASGSTTLTLPNSSGYRVKFLFRSLNGSGEGAFSITPAPNPCFADCDGSGTLNVDDIDCFVTGFLAGDLETSDCDGNGVCNIDDIDCFVASFLSGCP